MPITCPTCHTANLDGLQSCASCGRALHAQTEQGEAAEQAFRVGTHPTAADAADREAPSAGHASPHSLGGSTWARIAPWWVLTILGCLVLLESPRLPWVIRPDFGDTITINGFNSANILSGHDSVWAELQSVGVSLPEASSQTGSADDGSSSVIVIPSLSAIPAKFGGSGSGAKEGILVFVPASIALFITLWTVAGEREHRRSMARGVFVLGGLTLFPLLHDLFAARADVSGPLSQSIGIGIFVGLAGALATMVGSAFLYRSLRGS